ncbi:hypothetical protein CK203_077535 [Vitis vinifera]|uniref:Uncharacterized protein n=1 Tax=Vitis vinifera TaxID=29760 RepID=A0A438DTA8_VITVI|nr:hypothetical protein CK203_077535 [Vitis vinifera]
MRKISHTQHRFAPPKPFRTLCKTQEACAKMKGRLPFLFKQKVPSLRRATRQRASSAQVPSDSLSQATEASGIPPSEDGAATGATTSCPESSVRLPPTKKAKTSGPSESSKASESPADSEVPTDLSSKSIIRHSMLTAPPIEGNSDCRARPFHSELYFDQEAMRQQPELRDSYDLLQSPTAIHFSIDGRHGVLEAKHIAEALQIPFEPDDPASARASPPLSRAIHFGQMESVGGYSAPPGVPPMVAPPVLPQPEQGVLSAETTPPVPTLEATFAAPPTTPTVPPVVPTTSEPSISISDQQTTILRQIQQHLGLLPLPQPDLSASLATIVPTKDTTPTEVRIPPPQDEPPTVTAMPEDVSSPLEAPTTSS